MLEGHHDIATQGGVTSEIEAGNGGATGYRMDRDPTDILIERTEFSEFAALLGRGCFAVGIIDLAQDGVTLPGDQARASEKELRVPRNRVLVRTLLGAKDIVGAGNAYGGDKASTVLLAIAGTIGRR